MASALAPLPCGAPLVPQIPYHATKPAYCLPSTPASRSSMKPCATLCLGLILLACTLRAEGLPKVLLIGDSISIGYTPHVAAALRGQVQVKHHAGNAQHTGTGLKQLKRWLGDTEWDVIHFNWGLWDLCYRHPESKVQGLPTKYVGPLPHTWGKSRKKRKKIEVN